ncbi:hypothetical protein [Estrella lausannensis]|uniref:Putative membrane protein n=1 Tax=Estrella lausannensis TaxID=483423 RepID=A0A0H5DRQ1_9BACT|nr:hypothetical protein [Estrella lausannensis]CRX38898.1 putative membrane protein [Estrella lausannensis]
MENAPSETVKKIPRFKIAAFFFLYLYLFIMVLAFIFCSFRKPHPVGLTMETVQAIRMKDSP